METVFAMNRVQVNVSATNLLNASKLYGVAIFMFAEDAPFNKRVRFDFPEDLGNELRRETDAYEVATALLNNAKRVSGWDGDPSLREVLDYLEKVRDRDSYIFSCSEMGRIDKEVEALEKRRETFQQVKVRYEADQLLKSVTV